mgnify:CR=1 FL=1
MNMPKCSTCRRWKKEYWCIDCNYEAKDMVEVVRCKDCKNWHERENGAGDCQRCNSYRTNMNDYCSLAERREEK